MFLSAPQLRKLVGQGEKILFSLITLMTIFFLCHININRKISSNRYSRDVGDNLAGDSISADLE